MRSIYVALIRHAPTAWNAEGRVLGQADPPLSPEGVARATRWRLPADLRALTTRGQLGWAVSPLRRASETARILGAIAPVVEPRLAEQDWGRVDRARPCRRGTVRRPGRVGRARRPGASPRPRVLARVRAWLDELAAGDGPATWAAVTHMGVIRAVVARRSAGTSRSPPRCASCPSVIHRVRRRGDGLLQLVGLNEPLSP